MYVFVYIMWCSMMTRIRYGQDIQPLSAFRKEAASYVDRVRETGRPLVLTRNGQSAAVLIGAAQYDALLERLEMLEDIHEARVQVAQGETLSHQEVKAIIKRRYSGED